MPNDEEIAVTAGPTSTGADRSRGNGCTELIGASSSVFGPTVAAISLGHVGRELFDRRQGRNRTFNSARNVVAAVAMGLLGYVLSNRAIFFFVVAFVIPTLAAVASIRSVEIDCEVARIADVVSAQPPLPCGHSQVIRVPCGAIRAIVNLA